MAVNNYEVDRGTDTLPEEDRGGNLFVLCPCGGWSRAYLVSDVRGHVDAEISAQKWACQGCRGKWIASGRTSKQALAEAGGQTPEIVATINDRRIRAALLSQRKRDNEAPPDWITAAEMRELRENGDIPTRRFRVFNEEIQAFEVDLTAEKERLHLKIDQEADNEARRFVSVRAGQTEAYAEKEEEALHFSPGADPSDHPMLTLEASLIGVPVHDLATEVLGMATIWRPLNRAIEAHRRAAKVAVSAASNIQDAEAEAAIDWTAVTSAVLEGQGE